MMICLSASAGEGGVLGELLLADAIALACSPIPGSPLAPLTGGGVCGLDPFREDVCEAEGGSEGAGE